MSDKPTVGRWWWRAWTGEVGASYRWDRDKSYAFSRSVCCCVLVCVVLFCVLLLIAELGLISWWALPSVVYSTPLVPLLSTTFTLLTPVRVPVLKPFRFQMGGAAIANRLPRTCGRAGIDRFWCVCCWWCCLLWVCLIFGVVLCCVLLVMRRACVVICCAMLCYV